MNLVSFRLPRCLRLFSIFVLTGLSAALFARSAAAALTLSDQPTTNVTCVGGVCTATAATAVLNFNDLRSLLRRSSVRVDAGTAQDIVLAVSFRLASANSLTLAAAHSIEIDQPFLVTGSGGLNLFPADSKTEGILFFTKKGRIAFRNTSNSLTIAGQTYLLSNSIAQLVANVTAFPAGFHALANNYDASADGSYSRVPIRTDFSGTFEGLGNAISNFAYFGTVDNNVALFASLAPTGVLRNVRLLNANLLSENTFVQFLAPLVAYNAGRVLQCQATGSVRSDFLVTAGGLVSLNYGQIEKCFANVAVAGAQGATVGGLVGNAHALVTDSYATGQVSAGSGSDIGGLIGYFIGDSVTRTYATGLVFGGQTPYIGGLMGENRDDASGGSVTQSYWDITTSGASKGAGFGDESGITGLTTAQLQSGLPAGFDPAAWTQNPRVNGGLPYLIVNPPR